jgi:hypothetical protein
MLMIFAPWVAAHCMPSMIQESLPKPSSLSTLPTISFAPGATPRSEPPDAAPVPAIVEAVWVPCPLPSWVDSPGTKLFESLTCVARSGWFSS